VLNIFLNGLIRFAPLFLKVDRYMTSGIVDQITLECLMNKETYTKLMSHKTVVEERSKDRKFYRKRISNLTKELLAGEAPENLLPDVTFAFDNFVKTCIHFFKIIDESDIIQKDYEHLNEAPIVTGDVALENPADSEQAVIIEEDDKDSKPEIKNTDRCMMRSVKLINATLDNFVTLAAPTKAKDQSTNEPAKKELPKQKEINLTNPELKNKGINNKNEKKKNIAN